MFGGQNVYINSFCPLVCVFSVNNLPPELGTSFIQIKIFICYVF